MKKILKKLTAIGLALALTVGMCEVMPDKAYAAQSASLSYTFTSSEAGMAYGTITLSATYADTYYLYWGDASGNKLSYLGVPYSELGTCPTSDSILTVDFDITSPYAAIPQGAKKLMAMDSSGTKVATYDIPTYKQATGTISYNFALMSDVHFNRYSRYNSDDAVPAFDNALAFLDSIGIDFLGVSGDLSSSGEVDSYRKFKSATDEYPDMTVYSCMGNHDDNGSISTFAGYINTAKDTDENVTDIGDTDVDFVYHKGGDVFVFFSQTKWDYSVGGYLVTDEQLAWLENVLEKYSDQTVYLFFHTYFASEDGDVTTAVGNLINPGGYTYDLTYTFGNADEVRFRNLLNQYPNVTMFSGHSHWAYDQQKYNSNLNIGNIKFDRSGATLVHVSSVTEPRTIATNATSRTAQNCFMSEGMLASRYSDKTVYTGIDFMNSQWLSYAVYADHPDSETGDDKASSVTNSTVTNSSSSGQTVGRTKIKSLKNKKGKKLKITLKKIKGATGYYVRYCDNKKFKGYSQKKSKKRKVTIKKLDKNQKYWVKARAFVKSNGKKIYGNWSKVKKIKIKK